MIKDKGLIVILISLLIVGVSFFLPSSISKYFYYGGLFAFSGAITNELAIYMIFNKIPFIYGSGIIEINFKKFKKAIKKMIMEQFFTKDRLEKFIQEEYSKIDLVKVIENIDYSIVFDALKESIMSSKFGQFINMIGGESTLDSLKDDFNSKIKSAIKKVVESKTFEYELNKQISNSHIYQDLINKIDIIIDSRLNELTPKMVKELIENLIKEHLYWLVIWGGVFGGLIGVLSVLFI